MVKHSWSQLIHGRLVGTAHEKCQLCNSTATILICNLQEEPALWLCDEHTLQLIRVLVDEVVSKKESKVVTQWLSEQEAKKKTEKQMEKQALHVG